MLLKASVNYVGRTSMIIGIRVESENIHTGIKKHCNSSYFTMVAKNDAGESVEVPGLILDSEIEIRRFIKSLRRVQTKVNRRNEFMDSEFEAKNFMEELKNYNVTISYKP